MNISDIPLEKLIHRSHELLLALNEFLALSTYDDSSRIISSRILCDFAFEHADSVRILVSVGNFTSGLAVLRMQYEALTKAIWILYAASDSSINKLSSELKPETANWADKVPLLSEMLEQLKGKAPPNAIDPLLEFKENSWKPLSSYVHGGIHAINRNKKGYPAGLLVQEIKASNGLLLMTGMMLVVLSGDNRQMGRIPAIQQRFADCCPSLNV